MVKVLKKIFCPCFGRRYGVFFVFWRTARWGWPWLRLLLTTFTPARRSLLLPLNQLRQQFLYSPHSLIQSLNFQLNIDLKRSIKVKRHLRWPLQTQNWPWSPLSWSWFPYVLILVDIKRLRLDHEVHSHRSPIYEVLKKRKSLCGEVLEVPQEMERSTDHQSQIMKMMLMSFYATLEKPILKKD